MQSNHIKPEVNYREFRIHKLNTPEFSHVRLLLYWPIFGLLFLVSWSGCNRNEITIPSIVDSMI